MKRSASRSRAPLGRRWRSAIIATATLCFSWLSVPPANAETILSVLYAVPSNFSKLHDELSQKFTQKNPDIKIVFRSPAKDYEDGIQQILRSAVVGDTPDVAFIGLNQLRVLVDRGLAAPLDERAASEGGFETLGSVRSIVSLGRVQGRTYAMPFAVSTPILYVNEDLVRAAGGAMDAFPTTWDGVLALSRKIHALPKAPVGFSFQWDASGNWLVQALVNSHGGNLAKDGGCRVGFDGAAGAWTFDTLQKFHDQGMPDLTWSQGRQAFDAGTLGILAGSTSYVAQATRVAAGKFAFRTMPFPDMVPGGTLPAGGTSAVILTKDPEKQRAAWAYLKFATGPVGQTLMATDTGYMPVNRIAVDDPALLGNYLKQNPNQLTAIAQMPLMAPWESWAGPNGIKIIDMISSKAEAIIAGKLLAQDGLRQLVEEVPPLLPADCAVPTPLQ